MQRDNLESYLKTLRCKMHSFADRLRSYLPLYLNRSFHAHLLGLVRYRPDIAKSSVPNTTLLRLLRTNSTYTPNEASIESNRTNNRQWRKSSRPRPSFAPPFFSFCFSNRFYRPLGNRVGGRTLLRPHSTTITLFSSCTKSQPLDATKEMEQN